MAVDLLLCVATEFEGALLRERLDGSHPAVGDRPHRRRTCERRARRHAVSRDNGRTGDRRVRRRRGISSDPVFMSGTWSCAASECYGDLGATSPSGFLDMKALGFPVVEAPTPLFNELPMQLFPVERRVPFVTVSSLHRHRRAPRARSRGAPRGAVESMEGAAIAHVAHLHGVPVGEVRGISNIVTNRDTTTWRLKEAAVAAQEAVLAWIARR